MYIDRATSNRISYTQRTLQVSTIFKMYNNYNNFNVILKEQKKTNQYVIKQIFGNLKVKNKQIEEQEKRIMESNVTVHNVIVM